MNNNIAITPTADEEAPVVYKPARPELRGDIEGLGKFLFQLHSVHYVPILFFQEETTLQFYEQVVVASLVRKLWCFPKSSKTIVIPRFKIVNAAFTYGPKSIPWIVYALMSFAFMLVLIGLSTGGCQQYFGYYFNSGACAATAIGFLILFIPVPLLLFVPCCFKKHYVYFDVLNRESCCRCCCKSRTTTYDFRFKIVGFETSASNKVAFDEFYLMNYVYETLGKHGNEVMNNYHLLSHFNEVKLADPIHPIHADDSINDTMALLKAPSVLKELHGSACPPVTDSVIHFTNHSSNGHARKRQQQQSVAV